MRSSKARSALDFSAAVAGSTVDGAVPDDYGTIPNRTRSRVHPFTRPARRHGTGRRKCRERHGRSGCRPAPVFASCGKPIPILRSDHARPAPRPRPTAGDRNPRPAVPPTRRFEYMSARTNRPTRPMPGMSTTVGRSPGVDQDSAQTRSTAIFRWDREPRGYVRRPPAPAASDRARTKPAEQKGQALPPRSSEAAVSGSCTASGGRECRTARRGRAERDMRAAVRRS